jgi:YVTN family beta-propeller protein
MATAQSQSNRIPAGGASPNPASGISRRSHWGPVVWVVVGIVLGSTFAAGNFVLWPACSTCALGNIDAGFGPVDMVYDNANGHLFVLNSGPGGPWGVTVINGTTDSVAGFLPTSDRPESIAYDSRNGDIYVTPFLSGSTTVFNGTTGWVVATIQTLPAMEPITYDPVTGFIDTLNGTGGLLMINGSTNQVAGDYAVGAIDSPISTNPINGDVYVATKMQLGYSFNLTVVNGRNGIIESSIQLNGTPSAFAYDGENGRLYVVSWGEGASVDGLVTVLSGDGTRVLGTTPVGQLPVSIAIDDSLGSLYVANYYGSNLSVIDRTTDRTTASISLDPHPETVVYDSANRCVYALFYIPSDGGPSAHGFVTVVSPPGSDCPVPPAGFTLGDVVLTLLVLAFAPVAAIIYWKRSPKSVRSSASPVKIQVDQLNRP